jgi:hypothetical protein
MEMSKESRAALLRKPGTSENNVFFNGKIGVFEIYEGSRSDPGRSW